MINHPLAYWLLFSISNFAYQIPIPQILQHYSDLEHFVKDNIKSFISIKENNDSFIEESCHWAGIPNQHIITYIDPNYPPLLKEIAHPPPMLYVKGNPDMLSLHQIAVVGSRHPSYAGSSTTRLFTHDLVKAGLCITSGLALGVDGAAHRAAVHAGGKTIGVLGNGLYSIYPKRHASLAETIVEQGCLVSEFPLNALPHKKHFPQRNRIISGLSLGTLVVEATIRSGSLITAHYAAEQGREVFAIPGSIRNPLSQGCHQLLQEGAALTSSANDILDALGISHIPPTSDKPSSVLDSQQQQLLACVDYEETTIDEVIDRSRLSATMVARLLLNLELHGYISPTYQGYTRVK